MERKIFISRRRVSLELTLNGYQVTKIDVVEDIYSTLTKMKPNTKFNYLHEIIDQKRVVVFLDYKT